MMKKLLAFLLLIILSLSFLIFHDKGNEIIKPYLSSYIESQIKEKMSIKFQHLKIDAKNIQFTAIINKTTTLQAQGAFSLFTRTLDLNYTIHADGFTNKDISFDKKTTLKGTVTGSLNNMHIKGRAKADNFESTLTYQFQRKEKLIQNLHIDMEKGNIRELLLISQKPIYAQGKIDLHINIPLLKGDKTKGRADIKLYETLLDEKTIKEALNIDLPKKMKLSSVIHANIRKETIISNGKINTDLAVLDFKKAKYNLQDQTLESHYHLNVKDLEKFETVTKQKLHGALELNGSVRKKGKQLTVNSKGLGGLVHILLQDNQLKVDVTKVDIAQILYLLGEASYATGLVNGEVYLTNLKSMEGNFKLSSEAMKTVKPTIKKEFNITFEQPLNIHLESEGEIHTNAITAQSKIETDIFTLNSNNLSYNLKTALFQASYFLHIADLSKLKPFTNKALQGFLSINGNIKKDKILTMNGTTKDLEGEINFKLLNKTLKVNLKNVSAYKFMYVLIYPQIFNARLEGALTYNLTQQKGIFNSTLKQAQLLPNQLTSLIKAVQGVDLTKEYYNETRFSAKLYKDKINFDFQAKSKMTNLSVQSAKIDKINDTIDASYIIKIKDKDISGKIEGDVENPDVSINSSQFIQEELIQSIKNHKDTLKNLGIGEKEQEAVKDLLRGLFN